MCPNSPNYNINPGKKGYVLLAGIRRSQKYRTLAQRAGWIRQLPLNFVPLLSMRGMS